MVGAACGTTARTVSTSVSTARAGPTAVLTAISPAAHRKAFRSGIPKTAAVRLRWRAKIDILRAVFYLAI